MRLDQACHFLMSFVGTFGVDIGDVRLDRSVDADPVARFVVVAKHFMNNVHIHGIDIPTKDDPEESFEHHGEIDDETHQSA